MNNPGAKQHWETFKQFPPRQAPASFNVGALLEHAPMVYERRLTRQTVVRRVRFLGGGVEFHR
jgi:hypothetical protein